MKSEQLSGTAPVLALAVAAAAGLVFPSPAFGQAVSDRALSEVRADTVGDCTTLTITFNSRVQLLSAFPGGGRELHIRVKPLDKAGANRLRDTLRSPSTLPELRSIEWWLVLLVRIFTRYGVIDGYFGYGVGTCCTDLHSK